jgi:galactokinase
MKMKREQAEKLVESALETLAAWENATPEEVKRAKKSLETIQDEMENLDRFFRRVGGKTKERWSMYPKGHILMALSKESPYAGSAMFTVEGLINEAAGEDSDEENEE